MTASDRAETYCDMPFTSIYVLEDGSVYPCCVAQDKMAALGNLITDDMAIVWEHGFEPLRQQMLAGNPPDGCRNCILGYYHRQPLPEAPAAPAKKATPVPSVDRSQWVFSTPEREWLRLAAMATPDWPAMQAIARTALDYGQLRKLAGLHQLNGVVAWRLCDDRMDGIAPNIVRDSCQKHLNNLAWVNRQQWTADTAAIAAALSKAGFKFAIWRVPLPYVLYPGFAPTNWPRSVSHLDLSVDAPNQDRRTELIAAMGDLGFTATEGVWESGLGFGAPDKLGVYIHLLSRPSKRVGAAESDTMWIDIEAMPQVFASARQQDVWGVRLPVASPEIACCLRACALYYTTLRTRSEETAPGSLDQGEARLSPVPLGELSHIANLAAVEGFEWGAVDEFLRAVEKIARRDPEESLVNAILWSWRFADRLYGDLGRGITIAEDLLGGKPPQPRAWLLPSNSMFEWGEWPGDERMVFDLRDQTLDERISAGVWKATEVSHA